ncbi:MAG: beta-xylosidase [Chthoniobacterales bacterium]|nr:beta-xylosidase [Chthoniobacterales bacterium]
MPSAHASPFFNAHHSPTGAFASFTLGQRGASGGLGLELGGPANENLFIGLQSRDGKTYEALPFYAGSTDDSVRYDVSADPIARKQLVHPFPEKAITREFHIGSDTWRAGDLTFSVFTPHPAVPDPEKASRHALMAALVPAVFAEIHVDNTRGRKARTVFFGYAGADPYTHMRRFDDTAKAGLVGVAQGHRTAIASVSPGVTSALGFLIDTCLDPGHPENAAFGLGGTGALLAEVPAGTKKTFRFAICFHKAGTVTSHLDCRYSYTRFFPTLESVATYALAHWNAQVAQARAADRRLQRARLSDDRKFMLAHAVRSYYGSTEFLEHDGQPFWVVNEGEYRMMNTFDLTVDHLFFELDRNPWVVRNQLDWFVRRYSYQDKVRLPGDETEYPGGISFTHDMGVTNTLSRPGYSTYECFGLHGCFSHMTHEQLVNWVCCAVSYAKATGDTKWLRKNRKIFLACLASMVRRDHPVPSQRDGVMDADSNRCRGGSEITTYDSLDASLGQARRNLYLAVKCWAAYLGLEDVLTSFGEAGKARLANQQARLCAATIASFATEDGSLPALLEAGNASRIIPAIEGLVFPFQWGMASALSESGPSGNLIKALKHHLRAVLKPSICLFANGGWKLSSTNDNSWLSKIYLCQHVAERVLKLPADPRADAAHKAWLLHPENTFFAWSDQMVAGIARGSKYYPRGVTAWLWLRR